MDAFQHEWKSDRLCLLTTPSNSVNQKPTEGEWREFVAWFAQQVLLGDAQYRLELSFIKLTPCFDGLELSGPIRQRVCRRLCRLNRMDSRKATADFQRVRKPRAFDWTMRFAPWWLPDALGQKLLETAWDSKATFPCVSAIKRLSLLRGDGIFESFGWDRQQIHLHSECGKNGLKIGNGVMLILPSENANHRCPRYATAASKVGNRHLEFVNAAL
jgi:hypothetical protein